MIFGRDFKPTRKSYYKRKLVYHAELESGEIQIVNGLRPWLEAVKAVAENVDNAIAVVNRWRASGTDLPFEEWHIRENSFMYR